MTGFFTMAALVFNELTVIEPLVINMTCFARFVTNTHGGVLVLVKLQAEARNFTKSSFPLLPVHLRYW